jgi:hypothetical protein
MKRVHAALIALPLTASFACGSSLPSGSSGTAGTGGTVVNTGQSGAVGTAGTSAGGTVGTGGVGGTQGGTAGIGGGPPLSCLVDLLATCPLAGRCQIASKNNSSKYCFDSGETVSIVYPPSHCSGTGATVTEVRRADGTLCYSIEDVCLQESDDWVWKDGAGQVVARGHTDRYGSNGICETTGETCSEGSTTMNPSRPSCLTNQVRYPTINSGCLEGTCL